MISKIKISETQMQPLRTFTNKYGREYRLSGAENLTIDHKERSILPFKRNVYQLEKKVETKGKTKWQLVARKEERTNIINPMRDKLIKRERFDIKTGKLTEQSEITPLTLQVKGNIFNMNEPVRNWHFPERATMPNKIGLRLKGFNLTPMAKRVLNLIIKTR